MRALNHSCRCYFEYAFTLTVQKNGGVVSRFNQWNYVDTDECAEDLAGIKLIVVSKEKKGLYTDDYQVSFT